MTKRADLTSKQNIWFDAEAVDNTDLTLEQQYNTTISSAIINNHIGSGVLPEVLDQNVIFDSANSSGFLDGLAISPQANPTDNNFGNQLEVELTNSKVAGKRVVKVAIIGLDFESNLQYETFTFNTNEVQVGKRHFTKVLLLMFNDLYGTPSKSLNLGGRVVIREARPMTLSRSPIMCSQDIQPNLFFRNFFLDGFSTMESFLRAALPFYNKDDLNIQTGSLAKMYLLKDDIVTQVGEKFVATTNNIQKITLLLSVQNTEVGHETELDWTGSLVLSIYALQSNIECPSDIAPNLAIDFAPTNIPIAQISINYASLLASGIELSEEPQPVDFVFCTTPIALGNLITVGNYYAFALNRAGGANKCDIIIDVGSNEVEPSRITTFTGSLWVDIPEQDLWFRVWTDAAKISDGQAYEAGLGMTLPKVKLDQTTQMNSDYSYEGIQFIGEDVYQAVAAATTLESDSVPDQRTGQPVNSRQEIVPSIKLLNQIDITNLQQASEPLILGAIRDRNRKSFNPIDYLISTAIHSSTIVENEIILRLTDPSDLDRQDDTVSTNLKQALLKGELYGAKITPNNAQPTITYRISDAKLCTMMIGDVNGDGIIDSADLDLLNSYLNYSINMALPKTTEYVLTPGSPDVITYTNGYTTYTVPFSTASGLTFSLIRKSDGHKVNMDGTDGMLTADSSDPRLAKFISPTIAAATPPGKFQNIVGITDYVVFITNPSDVANFGGFEILAVDSDDILTLRKVILNGETISQIMRADIDQDFVISGNDETLLSNYIENVAATTSTPTYVSHPTQTNIYRNIGKKFEVIKITVERFKDRSDEYTANPFTRSTDIHPLQDIFLNDFASYQKVDFCVNPFALAIEKQVVWDESLIISNSNPKLVPCVFTSNYGFAINSCDKQGVDCSIGYPGQLAFDPGKIDLFAPNDLIIGGELTRPHGEPYKVDFEIGTVILEVPNNIDRHERVVNIFEAFVYSTLLDDGPSGMTNKGYPAMKYADCSYVLQNDILHNKLRFGVSVQSFSPAIDGYIGDVYFGVIVDGRIGVEINEETGMLKLNFSNLYEDPILRTLTTKIQIQVFLKKSGFNNIPILVNSTKVQNLLSLA